MKRLHILNKPTNVADLAQIDTDAYSDTWLFKAEKIQAKRLKSFRQQVV